MAHQQVESREKLIIRQVPHQAPDANEEQVFSDFAKLIFTPGPFPSSDEFNYNDGLEANPFDKIAKVYGRNKDLFLFNSILMDPKKREWIFLIVAEKCVGFNASFMPAFKKRLNIYLDRMSGGAQDAREALGENSGVKDAFFHGYHVAQREHIRNIHQNLNINVATGGTTLDTKGLMTQTTPRMQQEDSKLERIKIYGNGKRIMNVVKGANGQRNYSFSKFAKMELEINWFGKEPKTGNQSACSLVLEMNGGQVSAKKASIDGLPVKLDAIIGYTKENEEVLIRNKSLEKTLEEMNGNGIKVKAPTNFDCRSEEHVMILPAAPGKQKILTVDSSIKEVLADMEKLDFSGQPCTNSNDKLNYNDGIQTNPFIKLRKYYGRHKNVFVLIVAVTGRPEEVMNLARQKIGEDNPKEISEFEHRMNTFLANVASGRIDAEMFLDDEEFSQRYTGFFSGYRAPNEMHPKRNIHANLNLALGFVEEMKHRKTFAVTELFSRETPSYDEEKGELNRIKFFGGENQILTVCEKKEDGGEGKVRKVRDYKFTKFANGKLEVGWKGRELEGKSVERECVVFFSVEDGEFTISKAVMDLAVVKPGSLLQMAKQNDQVAFRDKTFYQVYTKAMEKGAGTRNQ